MRHERNSLVRLEGVWRDLCFGARQLRRHPGFALAAMLSLALGIGANTAIFSLLHQLLFRSLPGVRNPDTLVFLYHPGPLQGSSSSDEPGGPSFSYPVFRALQAQQTPFAGLAGARSLLADLSHRGQAFSARVHRVSGNYFAVLGVGAALGRVLTEADDGSAGAQPVAVLSHRLWTARFGGDPSVLQQTLLVNGYPLTIVGVAAPGFDGEYRRMPMDVFVPIGMNRALTPGWDGFDDRKDHWVTLSARLRPGLANEQAQAAMDVPYRAQLEEDMRFYRRGDAEFARRYRAKRIVLKEGRLGRGYPGSETALVLSVLMGITVLVLLICCTNVANLLLARGASRAREFSARLALGASRLRIVRQLLVEAVLLALAGAVFGLLVARWTMAALLAAIPNPHAAGPLSAGLDGRVLLYCLGLALASVFVFALAPAWRMTRLDLATAVRSPSPEPAGARPGRMLGPWLVTGQIAASVLLLVGAGLFAKTFVNLARAELGMRTSHLLTFAVQASLNRYSHEQAARLYDTIRERLAGLPGAGSASFAIVPAIAGSVSSTGITVTGFAAPGEDAAHCSYNEVGPDYFRTLGIPLVSGREIGPADGPEAPKVAVVNEAFARHFLAGREPLGQRLAWGTGRRVPDIEIVGVVRDATYSSLREAPPRVFYTAYRQRPEKAGLQFYVRTASEPEALMALVRSELAALAPEIPVRDLKTMRQQIGENVAGERLVSAVTGGFAALAVLLASIGLYGVLSYDVARRTREIGIRMALGADVGRVRRLVFRDVALMLAAGTVIGLAAAAAGGRVVQSLLYEVRPWDPAVFASAVLILTLVGVGAASLPARRASSVDPIFALRHD
jgi:predicted permease